MGLTRSKPKSLPFPRGKLGVGSADLMTDSSSGGVFVRLFYPIEPCDLKLNKRVNECIRAMHLLEEIHMGKCRRSDGSGNSKSACPSSKIVLGDDFDWSQFKGKLDLSRVAIGGHSFGGSTALAACGVCSEFRVGLILDGWMFPMQDHIYPEVSQPLLFLHSDYYRWKNSQAKQQYLSSLGEIEKLLRFQAADRTMITTRDSVHHSQTDFTYLLKGWLTEKFVKVRGPINEILCNEITDKLCLAFLRYHLELDTMNAIPGLLSEYEDWLIPGTSVSAEEQTSFSIL